ncbi:aspartyl-phosphate phosphatase Spo0E family protein [Neobacillus pocheonensis]|uniref:aspartyl-phosphate phosphatase Spo0E family protein n=1 Tax=Neobacillus pocheonensis TaxID=363869 RepID=UPI003D294F06
MAVVDAQLNELLAEIESCRKDMVRLAFETTFANQQVLEVSKKLDSLLYEYTLLMKK